MSCVVEKIANAIRFSFSTGGGERGKGGSVAGASLNQPLPPSHPRAIPSVMDLVQSIPSVMDLIQL